METMKKSKPSTFAYQARGADGKLYESKTQAPNAESVVAMLIERKFTPLNVEEVASGGLNSEINLFGEKRVKLTEVATWARELSVMIDAGISIIKALSILEKNTKNTSLKKALVETRRDIESGESLATSMEPHEKIFSSLMVNMIKAAEEGGFLPKALDQIATALEEEVALRAEIKSALTYPVVVLIMAILAVIGMLIFIVPVFQELFASLGGQLPLPTRMLVVASDFLKIGIFPILGVVVGFGFWWRNNKNNDYVRNIIDPLKLKLPVFGSLNQKIVMNRFTRNTATLLSSGVPILTTLDIVAKTTGSIVVTRAIADIKKSVDQGSSMSEPMAKHEVFPSMVTEMVSVGEEVGSIDVMMDKIADSYDKAIKAQTKQLTSLIEPLMIAFIGTIIGTMVIALYLPIFKVYDLIN